MSVGLYSHTTRATGVILTAAIYNSDHQNHITNQNPSMSGAYSDNLTQYQSNVDPGGLGTEDLALSLAGELERIRFVIKRITGKAQWYIAPATNLDSVGGTIVDLIATETVAFQGNLSPAQITANQNNYAPTNHADAFRFRLSSDATRDITGLAGGANGRVVLLTNIGSFIINLKHNDGASSAANRFFIAADVPIYPAQSFALEYDSTSNLWRPFSSAREVFRDFREGVPANPLADNVRVYGKDVSGTSRLAYRDSTGVETVLTAVPATLIEDIRLGTVAEQLIFTQSGQSPVPFSNAQQWPGQVPTANTSANYDVPAGGVAVGWRDVITNFTPAGCCTPADWTRTASWRYKPLQKQVGGSWVTVSG